MPRLPLLALGLSLAVPALALAQPTKDDAPRQAPPAEAPPAPAATPELRALLGALLAEADGLYGRRDEPGVLATIRGRLEEAEKLAPGDYGVLWRLARLAFWQADDPKLDGKEKSRLGKIAWDYGDRATTADPSRVEGWHYASAGVGNYALGIGIFTALRQGIEATRRRGARRRQRPSCARPSPGLRGGTLRPRSEGGRRWRGAPSPAADQEERP